MTASPPATARGKLNCDPLQKIAHLGEDALRNVTLKPICADLKPVCLAASVPAEAVRSAGNFSSCPLWVKSRNVRCTNPCPLWSRKRPQKRGHDGTSFAPHCSVAAISSGVPIGNKQELQLRRLTARSSKHEDICCHFVDRCRTSVRTGHRSWHREAEQAGRAEGCDNYQERQNQDPNLLRNK